MNRTRTTLILCALVCATLPLARGERHKALDLIFPESLNVRDFGAVGDGKADDTKAIQRALNRAFDMEEQRRIRLGVARGHMGGSRASAYPEVVFPEGTYLISETLRSRFSNVLRGVGKAKIVQTDPSKDIIYFERAYRNLVDNLSFDGGYIQLHFWTSNHWARLIVRNCRFYNSGHYAVECRSFTEKRLEGENWNRSQPWPPYLLEQREEGEFLVRNQSDALEYWYNSTLISIEGSHFEDCLYAINIAADAAVVRNCTLLTHPAMEGAALRMDGQAHLYGLDGTLRRNPGLQQYWVEGEGNVSIRQSSLLTDSPAGVTLFRSYIPPTATTRGIRLENVRTHSAGSPDNAIIVIEEGTMPNIIALYDVEEVSGQPVDAIAWPEGASRAFLEEIRLYGNLDLEAQYKISFAGNSSTINEQLPEDFASFQEEAAPASLLAATHVEQKLPDHNSLLVSYDVLLLAGEHGIEANSSKDQTTALQRLLDLAATHKRPLVVLPGASSLHISDTLVLPANVRLMAPGATFIIQQNPAKAIIRCVNPETLVFSNVDFVGGQHGIVLEGDTTGPATVSFDYCSFFDQRGAAIRLLLGEGSENYLNQTSLFVRNAIFSTQQGVVSNADYNLIDTLWAVNDAHLNEAAFFENRGGRMRIETMLGNPRLWYGKRSKGPPGIVDGGEWPYSRHTRWVDNWGQLYCQDIRFGGESGGMCNVYNRSELATVHVSGGMTRFNNGATRMAIVFVEAEPEAMVLRDISSFAGRVDGISARIMSPDGSPADEALMNLSVSGVLAP